MDIVVLKGRVPLVVLWRASGFGHLTQTQTRGGYAQATGVAAARAAVIASGLLIVVALFAATSGLGLTVTGPLFGELRS